MCLNVPLWATSLKRVFSLGEGPNGCASSGSHHGGVGKEEGYMSSLDIRMELDRGRDTWLEEMHCPLLLQVAAGLGWWHHGQAGGPR